MIIVDTNVIISFMLTRGITRRIIVGNRNVFIAPEFCFEELWEHRSEWNKHGLRDEELKEIIEKIKKHFIAPAKKDVYNGKLNLAISIINDIDDAPVLALALSVENEGIWTYNTKDFDTANVKKYARVLDTREVVKLHPI